MLQYEVENTVQANTSGP